MIGVGRDRLIMPIELSFSRRLNTRPIPSLSYYQGKSDDKMIHGTCREGADWKPGYSFYRHKRTACDRDDIWMCHHDIWMCHHDNIWMCHHDNIWMCHHDNIWMCHHDIWMCHHDNIWMCHHDIWMCHHDNTGCVTMTTLDVSP